MILCMGQLPLVQDPALPPVLSNMKCSTLVTVALHPQIVFHRRHLTCSHNLPVEQGLDPSELWLVMSIMVLLVADKCKVSEIYLKSLWCYTYHF